MFVKKIFKFSFAQHYQITYAQNYQITAYQRNVYKMKENKCSILDRYSKYSKRFNRQPPKKNWTPYRRWFFKSFLCNSIHFYKSDIHTKFQPILIKIVNVLSICNLGNLSVQIIFFWIFRTSENVKKTQLFKLFMIV